MHNMPTSTARCFFSQMNKNTICFVATSVLAHRTASVRFAPCLGFASHLIVFIHFKQIYYY